jgi:hypothetical protein
MKSRGDYFRFGSVFIKKSNQIEFFLKKKPKPNRNQIKLPGFGSVQIFSGFGSIFSGFSLIFSVLARFSSLARFWLRFFSGSVRFFAYKTKTELNQPVFSKF